MSRGRLLGIGVLVAAAVFAFFGGEFSTPQWLDLRRAERIERERVKTLGREVDSLLQLAKQVETDPETQERIAREQHGMLKPGEHAFIFEEPPDPRR